MSTFEIAVFWSHLTVHWTIGLTHYYPTGLTG